MNVAKYRKIKDDQYNSFIDSEKAEILRTQAEYSKQARCDATIEEIPEWLYDDDYIKTGYRINQQGACEVMATMCQCHNETVNIWTHFIGALTFLCLMFIILLCYQNVEEIGSQGSIAYNQLNAEILINEYLEQKIKFLEIQLVNMEDKFSSQNLN